MEWLKEKIKTVPNWPKEGIMFRDICSVLKEPVIFNRMMDVLIDRYKDMDIDAIAGIDSRGFITGSILAYKLNKPFILIRKKGKLPGDVIGQEYELEYGTDKIEIQKDALDKNDKVLVCDDLIATGGTLLAACDLIKKCGAEVTECCLIIDLPDVGGKKKVEDKGYKVYNMIEFEGD